jgi:hypothetical protein
VQPEAEQEAEQRRIRDQEEGGVLGKPEVDQPARERGNGKAEAVGRLACQLRLAFRPARHLDVAPVVVLLHLLRLVQEAELRGDGGDVHDEEGERQERATGRVRPAGERRPHARVGGERHAEA